MEKDNKIEWIDDSWHDAEDKPDPDYIGAVFLMHNETYFQGWLTSGIFYSKQHEILPEKWAYMDGVMMLKSINNQN